MKNRLFLLQLGCSLLIMFLLLALIPGGQRAAAAVDVSADAQKFIDEYTGQWLKLRYAYTQASWNSNTRIVENDDTNSKAENAALERLTAFTGSKKNIEKASAFLKQKEKLTPLQVKQLKSILYTEGSNRPYGTLKTIFALFPAINCRAIIIGCWNHEIKT